MGHGWQLLQVSWLSLKSADVVGSCDFRRTVQGASHVEGKHWEVSEVFQHGFQALIHSEVVSVFPVQLCLQKEALTCFDSAHGHAGPVLFALELVDHEIFFLSDLEVCVLWLQC